MLCCCTCSKLQYYQQTLSVTLETAVFTLELFVKHVSGTCTSSSNTGVIWGIIPYVSAMLAVAVTTLVLTEKRITEI